MREAVPDLPLLLGERLIVGLVPRLEQSATVLVIGSRAESNEELIFGISEAVFLFAFEKVVLRICLVLRKDPGW